MLKVDLRDLNRGPVSTEGRLEATDPTFEGLEVNLDGPVEVEGRLQATGHHGYYWQGTVSGRARMECRRCLTDLVVPVLARVDALFSSDPEAADDPSVYPLSEPVTHVDLRPAVREELALAVPAYALCREDCRGLCPRCGADLNAGPCSCGVTAERD